MHHLDGVKLRATAFGDIEIALLVIAIAVNNNNAPTQLAAPRAPKQLIETRLLRVAGG